MGKLLRNIPRAVLPGVLCLAAFVVMVLAIRLCNRADAIGTSIGTGAGTAVGKAIGSVDGMTNGRTEGTAAGKEAGLSAEDTRAEIASKIQQVEKLEVLVANVKLKNFHTIGDKVDYAALYVVNGSAVFTVDMSAADITFEDDSLYIVLPKPEGTFYIDQSTMDKVGEYQKTRFTGNAESGYDAYLNSLAKLSTVSEETLSNYDELLQAARDAAEKQVTSLAQSVSVNCRQIVVSFADEEGGNS